MEASEQFEAQQELLLLPGVSPAHERRRFIYVSHTGRECVYLHPPKSPQFGTWPVTQINVFVFFLAFLINSLQT